MPFGETQEQIDTFRALKQRIEQSFSDAVALVALEDEVQSADLDQYDRNDLLDRINQYLTDMEKPANALGE
jgi:uncharacterized membrane protein YukC